MTLDIAFTLKKTLTLLALVDPLLAIPVYLSATKNLSEKQTRTFAKTLGITVMTALLVAGFLGTYILSMLGVSLGAMQVGGGCIAFLLAIAMVLAKEEAVKMSPAENAQASAGPSLVPLAIPLLVGPASLSYVMASSNLQHVGDLLHIVTPAVIVGTATWAVFAFANKAGAWVTPSTANVVERISGFLLAAISVEMVAAGLKSLFPIIST
jgi:multiple antibiotic resistance protein